MQALSEWEGKTITLQNAQDKYLTYLPAEDKLVLGTHLVWPGSLANFFLHSEESDFSVNSLFVLESKKHPRRCIDVPQVLFQLDQQCD